MTKKQDLKYFINVLLQDYKEKNLMQHITIACADYDNLEVISNKNLEEKLEMYLQQLEIDDLLKTNFIDDEFDESEFGFDY